MSDPTTVSPDTDGFYDSTGAIATDHDCRRCGYNLRGLHDDGRCPECGTPVGLSVRGDMLRFADPDWVDKVALGLNIIVWMILLGILAALAAVLLAKVSPALQSLMTLAAAAVSFYGVWLMTEPDPSGIGEDPNLTARKVVRIALVAGLVGNVAAAAMGGAAPGAASKSLLLISGVAGLIGLIGEFAKYMFYERLASRIPDPALASRVRFLKWGFTISWAVVMLFGLFVAMSLIAVGASGVMPMVVFITSIAGIALFIFSLMTYLLLRRLRHSVMEQAKLARASWAAAMGPN